MPKDTQHIEAGVAELVEGLRWRLRGTTVELDDGFSIDALTEEEIEEHANWLRTYSKNLIEKVREDAFKEAIELSDHIERREPDGGTKQWIAFKAFRNTLRDRLSPTSKDNN